MKKLYDTTREMSSRFKVTNHQIRDLNGCLLTTSEDQSNKWVEHFQQLHNKPPPINPPILPPSNHNNINTDKTKTMRMNNKSNKRITINNHDIENVTSFKYLGSVINITGGTDEDVLCQEFSGKARSAFNILGSIWRFMEITTATKVRIFNSNVKSGLLYGS